MKNKLRQLANSAIFWLVLGAVLVLGLCTLAHAMSPTYPGIGSRITQVDQFTVTVVGTCTGGRYSSCAYTVSNGKEVWNMSLHRAMNVGWSITRTKWVTIFGSQEEAWN